MDQALFNKIASSKYADHASFAVWGGDITDLSVIADSVPILNTSIAIIGLNPSGDKRENMEAKFRGFHCNYPGCKDGYLRSAFQETVRAFKGAYMTDIVPTNASKHQGGVIVEPADLQDLATELAFIGFFEHEHPLVVVLGDKAYAALTMPLNSPTREFTFSDHVQTEFRKQVRIEKISHHARKGYTKEQFVAEAQQLASRLGLHDV